MNEWLECRVAVAMNEAFDAVFKAKPYEHVFLPRHDVCIKCGITAEQSVDLDARVCSVE